MFVGIRLAPQRHNAAIQYDFGLFHPACIVGRVENFDQSRLYRFIVDHIFDRDC